MIQNPCRWQFNQKKLFLMFMIEDEVVSCRKLVEQLNLRRCNFLLLGTTFFAGTLNKEKGKKRRFSANYR